MKISRALLPLAVVLLAARFAAALTIPRPAFCHGLDCPGFETLSEPKAPYEIRRYEAGSWVSTTIEDSFDAAQKAGFWKLFKYIGGANANSAVIPMTAPVRTMINRQSMFSTDKSSYTVSFFLPEKLQANPPAPTDSSVEIEHTPAVKVYVATYGGWHTPSKVRDAAASLQSKLEADGVSVDKDYLYITTYDSPMRLFFRHNEVWLVDASVSSYIKSAALTAQTRISNMLHAVTGSASAGTAAEAAADASKSASGYADAMSDSVSGSANDAATGVQGALRRMGSALGLVDDRTEVQKLGDAVSAQTDAAIGALYDYSGRAVDRSRAALYAASDAVKDAVPGIDNCTPTQKAADEASQRVGDAKAWLYDSAGNVIDRATAARYAAMDTLRDITPGLEPHRSPAQKKAAAAMNALRDVTPGIDNRTPAQKGADAARAKTQEAADAVYAQGQEAASAAGAKGQQAVNFLYNAQGEVVSRMDAASRSAYERVRDILPGKDKRTAAQKVSDALYNARGEVVDAGTAAQYFVVDNSRAAYNAAGDNFNAASNASQSFIQRWWNWILCLFGLRETRTQYAQRHASEAGACVQDAANTASQAAGDVYDKAGAAASDAYNRAGEAAGDVASRAQATVNQGKHAATDAQQAAQDTYDRASKAADNAYDRAADAAGQVGDKAAAARDEGARRARNAAGSAQNAMADAAGSAQDQAAGVHPFPVSLIPNQ